MSLTVNATTYAPDSGSANTASYRSSTHTVTTKDEVRLARTPPKPTSTFSGVGRTSAKLTRTLTLTGALTPTWDAILDVQISVPVGFTAANVDSMLNDMGAYVASAPFKLHVKNQQITF
jgi:hypothetical protein